MLVADPPTDTTAPAFIVRVSTPATLLSVPREPLLNVIVSLVLLLLTAMAPLIVAPLFTVRFSRPPPLVCTAYLSPPVPTTAPLLRVILKTLSWRSLAFRAAPWAPPVTRPLTVIDMLPT